MQYNEKLKELKTMKFEAPKKVLSLYLNTDLSQPSQHDGEWKIRLKNGFNKLEEYIENSGNHDELQQIQSIKQAVEKEIHAHARNFSRSMVIFATADQEVWFVEKMPVAVETAFFWETYPVTEQLESLERNYPYMGIVVLQKDEAAVLETEMGILTDKTNYMLDLDTDDWREHQGPQGDDLTVGGQKKDEFNNRVEANRDRWFKSLVTKIEKKAGKKNWKKLYLVGEKEEVEQLKSHFSKKIDRTIPDNILNWKDHEILTKVFDSEADLGQPIQEERSISMKNYTVAPNKDATAWYVKVEDIAPIKEYDKKDKAIEAGEQLAAENKPATLSILTKNHEVADTRKFA
ncbi:VLRF1 family aeRF1-type release factor [Radiobacillus sp. PE A8.2]|uniref:VLRF1 family aeRF1-type release factor n=1 Tax=Radiobacillus sp. PE A8.2 TaxID=3380349 RepID=UPI003890A552